jgi:hypothetical protein
MAHRSSPGFADPETAGAVHEFDRWLRQRFVELNTKLEGAYFAAGRTLISGPAGIEELKRAVLLEGAQRIAPIAALGAIPDDDARRYHLLGGVGLYLAACRRHEVDDSGWGSAATLAPAWRLADRLGTALGVAPRFVFAHQSLYGHRLFTSLDDEDIWVANNTLGVLAYRRAADALRDIPAMGVASPGAAYLLEAARSALEDVLRFNRILSQTLDGDRFFLNIRTYFKPYRVGSRHYRGANAGDFAAINEIDLRLGLCRADDPFYQGVLVDKYPYVPPEDQPVLRAATTGRSLLADLLREAGGGPVPARIRTNAALFLAVCRAHGAAYAFHHHRLVKPFLQQPSTAVARAAAGLGDTSDTADSSDTSGPSATATAQAADLTASGPPLDVVVAGLARLADLRAARDRPGVPTARADLDRLRAALG